MKRTTPIPPKRRSREHRVLSSLQKDILRTLLYFDVFDHPLTPAEIFRYLPANSVTETSVAQALTAQPLRGLLRWQERFVFVAPGTTSSSHAFRGDRERRARSLVRIARIMARIIGSFPFVRGVFITGELSKGVAGPDADIDFVVVTAPDRLWIARTLLIGFKKIFLLNNKRYFCLNHFVCESDLTETTANRYVAIEIASLVPLISPELLRSYHDQNPWVRDFLPNARPKDPQSPPVRPFLPRRVQAFVELLFFDSIGDRLDTRLMGVWRSIWRRRYPDLGDVARDTLFRTERTISTAYVGDFQPKILSAYRRRLRQFNLPPSRIDG